MTYGELLEQLKKVEDRRLDEEVKVYVSGEYYSEVLPVEEFIDCLEDGHLQFTVNTLG